MDRVKRGEMQGALSGGTAPVAAGLSANERGLALVLALVMLAMLTVLGAWVIGASSTELAITGNSRNTQNAFYSAEAALAYATNPVTLTTAYEYSSTTCSTAVWSQVISVGADTAAITINYLGSGPLPAGSFYDGDLDVDGNPRFHGLYFVVNAASTAANTTAMAVEAAVVKVVEDNNIVGCNGGSCISNATVGEQVLTLYWRQR